MPPSRSSALYGNLNLLILKSLETGPQHGLAVARMIRSASDDVLQIEEGALYPALHRLEADGLVKASWGASETNRRAKYYALTAAGRRALARELDSWIRHALAVSRVLNLTWK
jgi:transcriptional regulator